MNSVNMSFNDKPFFAVWSLWLEAAWCLRPTSLRGPVETAAADGFQPSILPLLTWSPLLLEKIIDVVYFAKSFKERDEIQELGVWHVVKPGRDGNCVVGMEDVGGRRVVDDDDFV